MIRKSDLLIGICILILAGAGAFAGYLTFDFGAYRISSTVAPDWQTYRQFGFEFKYPPGWNIEKTRGSDSPLVIYLRPTPPQSGNADLPGLEIEILRPYIPVADFVNAWKTLDEFKSDSAFRTQFITGRRLVFWDRRHPIQVPVYVFNRPGTKTVFKINVHGSVGDLFQVLDLVP